mmetsp:Transcript_19368/g.40399  ORF Transcript_19368/g.40399 Transcript_19368/m.40399 type:complete len:325 (-) Transcript_19368:1896-2870(-)
MVLLVAKLVKKPGKEFFKVNTAASVFVDLRVTVVDLVCGHLYQVTAAEQVPELNPINFPTFVRIKVLEGVLHLHFKPLVGAHVLPLLLLLLVLRLHGLLSLLDNTWILLGEHLLMHLQPGVFDEHIEIKHALSRPFFPNPGLLDPLVQRTPCLGAIVQVPLCMRSLLREPFLRRVLSLLNLPYALGLTKKPGLGLILALNMVGGLETPLCQERRSLLKSDLVLECNLPPIRQESIALANLNVELDGLPPSLVQVDQGEAHLLPNANVLVPNPHQAILSVILLRPSLLRPLCPFAEPIVILDTLQILYLGLLCELVQPDYVRLLF